MHRNVPYGGKAAEGYFFFLVAVNVRKGKEETHHHLLIPRLRKLYKVEVSGTTTTIL